MRTSEDILKEYVRQYNKIYYKKNREKLLQKSKDWQKVNKESRKEYRRKYYLENKK